MTDTEKRTSESESMSNFNDVTGFYKNLLHMFGRNQYILAEAYFYSRLGLFRRFFDRRFYIRCSINQMRPQHRHRKFLKDLWEFGRCIKRNQKKNIEYEIGVVNIGYGKLLDFNILKQIHNENLVERGMDLDYLYHYCILISGSWTDDFMNEILELYTRDSTNSEKYYLVTSLLEKSMYETNTFKREFKELNIEPDDILTVPHTVDEMIRYRKEKEAAANKDRGVRKGDVNDNC